MAKRTLVLAMSMGLGLTAAACEVERAPSDITCDKLRALKAGMSIDDVRTLLESSFRETHKDEQTNFGGPRDADTQWDWRNEFNGVRLYLYFRKGRLLAADSWIRTTWRDFFDNESRPVLFTLRSDGSVQEGQDFKRIYCP